MVAAAFPATNVPMRSKSHRHHKKSASHPAEIQWIPSLRHPFFHVITVSAFFCPFFNPSNSRLIIATGVSGANLAMQDFLLFQHHWNAVIAGLSSLHPLKKLKDRGRAR